MQVPSRSKEKGKDRTVARSFRLSELAIRALEEEAERENISVSSVLNRNLVAFAEFDRYFRRLGMIKISLSTLRKFFDNVSLETAAIIGKEAGFDTAKSVIFAKYGELTLQTVISYFVMGSEFGGMFQFSEVDEGSKKVITLQHLLGPQGSSFFSNYTAQMFEAAGFHPNITSTENSIIIEIVT